MPHKLTLSLISPLDQLKGIGDKTIINLNKINLFTLGDALFHLPQQYVDRTRITDIREIKAPGTFQIQGIIRNPRVSFRRRRMFQFSVDDGTGSVSIWLFHFNKNQQMQLRSGKIIRCFGQVNAMSFDWAMSHPQYQIIDPDNPLPLPTHHQAIYPSTAGLQQRSIEKIIAQSLEYVDEIAETLPNELIQAHSLLGLADSLKALHQLSDQAELTQLENRTHPGQRRLILEELAAHHLGIQLARLARQRHLAPAMSKQNVLFERLIKMLPFPLTQAQQRCVQEISSDMQLGTAMHRLIQGDVGSGKTLVACAAASLALSNQYQVAIMAPTEILAEQLHQNFSNWLSPQGIKTAFLHGNLTAKEKRELSKQIESQQVDLVVGTHALFQHDVHFKQLGLLIIDEQHRFGVKQRQALRNKGVSGQTHPHQLVMTATPIPRTLAQTLYGDLDLSVIDELPPNRKPINTITVSDQRRDDVIERISKACEQGQQAYWVCTLVEESEALQCQAAEQTALDLSEQLPHLKIGLVHGRLKKHEKIDVMSAFKQGNIDILVATTVIEVGVDVPNASIMIIENPERLGLSQLHQLRGRVGRGETASHCILMFGKNLSETAKTRLTAMRDSQDGFHLAEVDLRIRGAGEILGTQQTGLVQMKVARLPEDEECLAEATTLAKTLIEQHPDYVQRLMDIWLNQAHPDRLTDLLHS